MQKCSFYYVSDPNIVLISPQYHSDTSEKNTRLELSSQIASTHLHVSRPVSIRTAGHIQYGGELITAVIIITQRLLKQEAHVVAIPWRR